MLSRAERRTLAEGSAFSISPSAGMFSTIVRSPAR